MAKIRAQWDPTLGAFDALSLSYFDVTNNHESVSGMIIHPTVIFTNLTHVLWRYAFSTDFPQTSGVVHNLTLVVYPLCSVSSAYHVDFFYTTYVGLLNPLFFLTVPNFVALSLLAYVSVHEESKSLQELHE